jgi:hypothetical protein
MLKNVLIGTNVSYTSAANPYLLTSGQIGVYSLANDGTYTLITSAISTAQAKLPVVIAQGVPAGKNIKMFTIQPGEKKAYLGTNYAAPIPNVFVTGYDGVTAAYALPSGLAGTYDFKVQNLTYGNPPFPTVGSTPFFQTNASATQIAIAESIVKDVNAQMLLSNNDVMPAQRFAFAETLSAAATAAPTSTPTATVTNGSTTVTLSTTSVDMIIGSWLRFGAANGTTYAIYQIANVNGTTVTLTKPYVNSLLSVGASISGLTTGFVINATVVAANAGIRVTETGNTFNGSNVLEPMPNKILNVSCNVNLSGAPVQNNQVVAKAFTSATGTISANYVSAAGALGTIADVTVNVTSTAGLIEGMTVSVTAGTGAFAAGTRVAAIVDATSFVVDTPIVTALAGGATVVTGALPTYTEGNGTYPQVFKKELTAAGYSGFINRIFLPDNFPLYSVNGVKYVTIGLQYGTSVNDYTAQGYKAGETLSAIIAVELGGAQAGNLATILSSTNW